MSRPDRQILTGLALLITTALQAHAQTPVFTFEGSGAVRAGTVTRAAGDVNNDGHADILVAYPGEDAARGVARVFSGKDGRLLHQKTNAGGASFDYYGEPCGSAGDANNDGHADFFVAAGTGLGSNTPKPRVDVFSGKDGKLLFQLTGNLRESFGQSCCAAGDLNKDGHDDLAVTVPGFTVNTNIRVQVYSGKDGSLMRTVPGTGAHNVRSAGDVDADGYPDVIVSSPMDGPAAGYAEVLSGRWLGTGSGTQVLHRFAGSIPYDRVGASVAGVGDVDKDGYDDFAVGDEPVIAQKAARVRSGKTGAVLHTLPFATGAVLAGVGDVNGDGYPDVAIGDNYALNSNGRSGEVKVYSGKDGSLLYRVTGDGPGNLSDGDGLGIDVAGLGDVNGDGVPDFVAGASTAQIGNVKETGYARVFSGKLLSLSTDGHVFSLSVANTQKLMLDAGQQYAGRLYHVFGSVTGTSPGVKLASAVGTVTVPLNPDPWTDITIAFANSPFLVNTRGKLDGNGMATAEIKTSPAPNNPVLVGLVLYHAALVYDAGNNFYLATNPVTLLFEK